MIIILAIHPQLNLLYQRLTVAEGACMCLELNYKEKRKKPLAGGIIISIIMRGQDAWVLAVRPTLRLSVRFLQKR